MLTVYTFGDSILDCAAYNAHGVHPAQLLVRNDDDLFPEFAGRDLSTHGPARVEARAADGSTVEDLTQQAWGLVGSRPALALVTVGGNDLLAGLFEDDGRGVVTFADRLDAFLRDLPIRPVFIGNVYDPSGGDDDQNFTGLEPALARAAHLRVNAAIAQVAARHGTLVDLHAHFLTGDASWFTHVIEPSLVGASEIRRAFLRPIFASLEISR